MGSHSTGNRYRQSSSPNRVPVVNWKRNQDYVVQHFDQDYGHNFLPKDAHHHYVKSDETDKKRLEKSERKSAKEFERKSSEESECSSDESEFPFDLSN